MGIVELIIVLIVVGMALYLINAYIPMAQPIKIVINVIVIIALCLLLLSWAGIGNGSWRLK